MTAFGPPEGMPDVEWLVALEHIRYLKARRDRFIDEHDYDAYLALHAPDHVSHNKGFPAWTSSEQMITNVREQMSGLTTFHHSHTPEILFESPVKAKGIWAMSGGVVYEEGGETRWRLNAGYYDETYEKRDGQWLFTSRRWRTTLALAPDGAELTT